MAAAEPGAGLRLRAVAAMLLLVAASLTAQAASMGPLVTDKPVRWNGGTFKLGDAEAQVRKAAGRYPDSAQPLYMSERYPIGESWTFLGNKQDLRVLRVEFMRGRVSRVWTESGETADEPLSRQ